MNFFETLRYQLSGVRVRGAVSAASVAVGMYRVAVGMGSREGCPYDGSRRRRWGVGGREGWGLRVVLKSKGGGCATISDSSLRCAAFRMTEGALRSE